MLIYLNFYDTVIPKKLLKLATQFVLYFLLMTKSVFAEPQRGDMIDVTVNIKGENVVVDLNMTVLATQQEVWKVLTDFDHMASFISNIKESKVLGVSGNVVKISQRGLAAYGPINFPFESTREIRLNPFERIQSRMISGNLHKMESTTQLVETAEGIRILYHSDTIPGTWIPPLVGKSFIEHESRAQFQEIRNEIIKRKAVIKP
jgi:hypothetical protein